MKNRVIMHYDMDAFYASIEIRDNPELLNKPVIVGTHVVTTCNYEARKYGLHSAMSVRDARKLCPQGIYLEVNKEKYSEVSKTIKSLVLKLTDKVEFIALDEGYVDITEVVKDYPSYEYFGKRFKHGIKKHVGLTCSVGIGYNKLSAKIASEAFKPSGFFMLLNQRKFINYIEEKEIKIIPGIGKKTREELLKLGIEKVKDIQRYSLQELRGLLGYNRGNMIYEYCRGIDLRDVKRKRKNLSISNEHSYGQVFQDEEYIAIEFEKLFDRTYERMINTDYYCHGISIKVKYRGENPITRSSSFEKLTKGKLKLKNALNELVKQVNVEKEIRLLGVSLNNISKVKNHQLTFKFKEKI